MTRTVLRIILIGSLIGLAIWQYTIVFGSQKQVKRGTSADDLSFETYDGMTVDLPDESAEKFTVLIFWTSSSERSMQELQEAFKLAQDPEIDSMFQFYFLNPSETKDEIDAAVDADKYAPYLALNPSGKFLEEHKIRALPLTAVYSNNGSMMDLIEGYQEGDLKSRSKGWIQAYKMTGPEGELRFAF